MSSETQLIPTMKSEHKTTVPAMIWRGQPPEKPEQPNYGSTDVNGRRGAIPRVFKHIPWKPGQLNLDIGGGKWNVTTNWLLEQHQVLNLVYDPYRRSKEWNLMVRSMVDEYNKFDSVTVANVLNVIPSEKIRNGVIEQAYKSLWNHSPGYAYFQIAEGNRSGESHWTSKKTWQANKKTAEFIPEIKEVFPYVEPWKGFIRASKVSPGDH